MRAVNILLSILISLLLAGLVLEGGLRLVGFAPPASINEFHEELGWVKKADAVVERSTAEFDVTFETNSQGLRDDADLELTKKAGVYRVLMLGDSFVLGYTVDREDLFVDQIEGWWKSEERRAEVINAGTEGYSTDQEVLWFQRIGKDYEPDVVLLFPYANDIYWNGEARYNRFPKPRYAEDGTLQTGALVDPGKAPLLARLATGRVLGLLLAPRGVGGPHTFQPPGASGPIASEFAPFMTAPPAFLGEALARTRGALKALKTTCDAQGARLLVCPIPPETAIHEDERLSFGEQHLGGLDAEAWDPMLPVNTFLAMAEELDIETMDPRQALQTRADAGERLYFRDEWHFNPEGNVAMASFLHKEFDNRGLFPAEHQAIDQGAIPEPPARTGAPGWLKLYGALLVALSILYCSSYPDDRLWGPPKIAGLLGLIFTIVLGGGRLIGLLPPAYARWALIGFVCLILGFVAWKLGRRLGTIFELLKAFTLRGHWYLMPLVVVLLTIGSLLVVAASSPLVAPFIYTLF